MVLPGVLPGGTRSWLEKEEICHDLSRKGGGRGELWSYLGTGLNVVLDHGDSCHRKQGFGHLKRQRPEASPWERTEKHVSAFCLPLSPPHQPLQPNLLHSFPWLLTLLRASNQDHSLKHDDECFLNFKSQKRSQAQISYPNLETPLLPQPNPK